MMFVFWVACTDNQADNGNSSGDENGRIIVPDVEWQNDENNGNNEPTDIQPADEENTETENPDTENDSDVENHTGTIVAGGPIELSMTINGEEYPIDQPVLLHDGEAVEFVFTFTTTGINLAECEITNTAPVQIPKHKQLEGLTDSVSYEFTYNSRTWGDGKINIIVVNRSGDTTSFSISVGPAQMPGMIH